MDVGSAVDYAHRKGNTLADDFVVVGREERCHQIRFARNQITISKIWDEAKLDVFMAVGSKNSITTVENIQTEESIKKELHSFAKFVRSLPENPMYQGIYPEALTFPTELRRYYDNG